MDLWILREMADYKSLLASFVVFFGAKFVLPLIADGRPPSKKK